LTGDRMNVDDSDPLPFDLHPLAAGQPVPAAAAPGATARQAAPAAASAASPASATGGAPAVNGVSNLSIGE